MKMNRSSSAALLVAIVLLLQTSTCHPSTEPPNESNSSEAASSNATPAPSTTAALPLDVQELLEAFTGHCFVYRPYLANSSDYLETIQRVYNESTGKSMKRNYACYVTYACNFRRYDGNISCPAHINVLGTCFPETLTGETADMNCPEFYNGIPYYVTDDVTRMCNDNGTWATKANYDACTPIIDPDLTTECVNRVFGRNKSNVTSEDTICDSHFTHLIIITFVGRGISLVALSITFVIFWTLKSVRCTRNILHWNLTVSLILRNVFWIVMFTQVTLEGRNQNTIECRLAVIIFNYTQVTSYCWMFVEGLFVHILVTMPYRHDRRKLRHFMIIGWGLPLPIMAIWIIVKYNLEDRLCWMSENNDSVADYFYQIPTMVFLTLNAAILVNIVRIVVTQLRRKISDKGRLDYWKPARAALLLFPVLGINYILFYAYPNRGPEGELAFYYINTFLQSFQGLYVAVICCFANSEIVSEIKKKFSRWRMQRSIPFCTKSTKNRRFSSMSASRYTQAYRFPSKSSDASPRISKSSSPPLDGSIRKSGTALQPLERHLAAEENQMQNNNEPKGELYHLMSGHASSDSRVDQITDNAANGLAARSEQAISSEHF